MHRLLIVGVALVAGYVALTTPRGEREAFERLAAAEVARHFEPVEAPRTRLLILGTFHFADAGLDDYRPQHDVDVLSAERQEEVAEVVELLRGFRPTKVAVEATPDLQERLDGLYQRYRAGEYDLEANEVFQLGFRLAGSLDLDGVHCVDAAGRRYEGLAARAEFARANGMAHLLHDPFDAAYQALYRADDERKLGWSLREHLLYVNAGPRVRIGHGAYLTGGFAVGDGQEFPGPDGFVSSWYNRNLRILSNVLRLAEAPDERILLVIGGGHLSILGHTARAAPQVELVDVADFLARD